MTACLPASRFPLTEELGLEPGQRIRFETKDVTTRAYYPTVTGLPPFPEWDMEALEVTFGLFRRPGDRRLCHSIAGSIIGVGTVRWIWLAMDAECVDIYAEVPGTGRTVPLSVFPEWDHIEVLG